MVTARRALLWWPPVAVVAMFVLGWAVGRTSTPVDDWFQGHDFPRWWLLVVDRRVLLTTLAATCGVALWRKRWRLAAATVICPLVGLAAVSVLKSLFGRFSGGALAYPSGHVTTLVVVSGLVVLAAGCRRWVAALATIAVVLGILRVGSTFHYFTDTLGAVLLGTALVAVAAQLTRPLT